MRAMRAPAAVLMLCGAVSCAARIPHATSFNPVEWAAVESIAPGVRVEVRYVSGDPPLRRTFEGTFRSASAEILEIETRNGTQRMIPNRVMRVSVGARENRAIELATLLGLAGAIAGGMWSASLDDDSHTMTAIAGGGGALIGFGIGNRRPQSRPRVVYER